MAFELCALLALINNLFEIRVDKYKLIKFTKRPTPMGASSIGVWGLLFKVVTTMGIFSSIGIICLTEGILSSSKTAQLI